MGQLLEEILAYKRQSVLTMRTEGPRPAGAETRPTIPALRRAPGAPLNLIAEVKFRSPSVPDGFSTALIASERALRYERAGAKMVSVLTDDRYFGGSFDDLLNAHHSTRVPILCKDFIVHPLQARNAWRHGADALLLIARCLTAWELGQMTKTVRRRGLEPFFEVTTEEELKRTLTLDPKIIGVNARDLDTLRMDPERAKRVLAQIPDGIIAVHLSGLETPEDVARIARTRADAALIGSSLMREDDPTKLLKSMVAAT